MAVDERSRTWFASRYWEDDELLERARDEFASIGPLIEVPRETGALLASLVRATGARRVIEVGTLFGYSAVWMARALPDGGHLDTLELEDRHADAAERLFDEAGLSDVITVHRGYAADTIAQLDGPYDLAFIDADKVGYSGYLEQLIDRMRPGGTIIADNCAQAGRVADAANDEPSTVAMREFLAHIHDHPRLDSNVLPIGDGVSISVVR